MVSDTKHVGRLDNIYVLTKLGYTRVNCQCGGRLTPIIGDLACSQGLLMFKRFPTGKVVEKISCVPDCRKPHWYRCTRCERTYLIRTRRST